MGCLSTATIARIKAKIAKLDAQITAYEAAFLAAGSGSGTEEYRFDSGDGSQRVKYRDPNMIKKVLDELESQRDRLQRKLDGGGIVSMSLRRKRGGLGFGRY